MFVSADSPPLMPDRAAALAHAIADLFAVRDITTEWRIPEQIRFRGTFLCDLATQFDELRRRFEAFGYTPLIRTDPDGEVILVALPHIFEKQPTRWLLNLLLFLATIISTMFVGGQEAIATEGIWPGILQGWPFSLSILLILGAHELGHYFAARYHNVSVSLPYFLPVPTIIGTMGAFISIREPIKNRRALLDIGAAGPLAGLVFALPLTLIGLIMSPVQPLPEGAFMLEGNSLLYAALKFLTKGMWLPSPDGLDVHLTSVAWAGWCGLFVTGLNLLPIGQLDGGHMAYVLFGRYARHLFWPVVLGLIGISLLLNVGTWWFWILLLFFFGQRHAEPLDDITPLDPRRRLIAILTLVLFFLLFVPIPLRFIGP
jgi:membrane-associated protease RseP (regulator of RpoE activity)